MFSLNNMPTTTSVFSTYTTFAALVMVIRTVFNEIRTMANHLIPQQLQEKILSKLGGFLGNFSSQMTLMIDEQSGLSINEIYQASELYLRTKITPSIERLKVSKAPKEKNLSVTMNKGEKIVDVFEGIQLKWELVCNESQKSYFDQSYGMQAYEKSENRTLELSFNKKFKERVLDTYLPYVVDRSKEIKLENKVVKLHSIDFTKGANCGGPWEPINLHHPSTFDTLAMDPALKKELIDDLDRFVKRREFYRKVGKAWKRGYLFYGPPGTGKSSLVAAMANYLKFDIYDLELTNVHTNLDLRRLLLSTENGSIIVIEDIDCSISLQDRKEPPQGQRFGRYGPMENQVTLSGLLNFIDGLWSSCGDEKIIIFTTNHKHRLDSALLRPGRMDKHIHMSYCTPSGFKILASNYLGINSHNLFAEIEELITEVEVTSAEIAEELMKSEDVDIVLKGLVKFLQRKKVEAELIMSKIEGLKEVDEKGKES